MQFLGYDFSNEELLTEALTVPSYRMLFPSAKDNQRLEYLGDAVLGLLAAEMLSVALPPAKIVIFWHRSEDAESVFQRNRLEVYRIECLDTWYGYRFDCRTFVDEGRIKRREDADP